MTQVSKIITALITKAVDDASNGIQTVYDNVLERVSDSAALYQRVNIMPAEPENITFGDGAYRETYVVQISISVPGGSGTDAAYARADVLRAAFARGTSFIDSEVKASVLATPSVKVGGQDSDRWVLHVVVRITANIVT